MHPRSRKLLLTATALLALGGLGLTPVAAGPEGATVVGGAAAIVGAGTANVTVNVGTSRAIINWNTFNIGVGETTRFNQPSSSSVVLNRVTGGLGPSEILGTLTANGRVFVINRDGILFGPGAVINTAGFLATTHDIKNEDFMAGRYNFNIPGRPDASIVNQGTITAASGGFAALVAPGVRNSGTITATLGTVALAAGNSFTLDLYGDRLITLAVNDTIAATVKDVATGQPLKSLITNDGRIKANGGRVELTAAAARTVVDSVINTSGVIKANSIGTRNGLIVLSAATGASKPAGAPPQTIRISGTLSAAGKKSGTKGGTILVTGEDIRFVNAVVDASGRAGGGKVLIGGDWTGGKPTAGLVSNPSAKLETFAIPTATTVSVDAGTRIDASARDRGDGGKVILWSEQLTTFTGTILARGGADGGNGGFVETSSHQTLNFAGTVDTHAPLGRAGTLLLDPADITIDAPTAAGIQTALLTTNVVIATGTSGPGNGDIFVNNSISWATNKSLTLNAFHDIKVAATATITSSGGGDLILRADSTGTGAGLGTARGWVEFLATSGAQVFMSNGGSVSIFYNPVNYASPHNYSGNVSIAGGSALTSYMLVNNPTDLGNIATNLGGTYALGRDISNVGAFSPIGSVSSPFTGLLDGQNHVISDVTIAPTSNLSSIGLFASIGVGGTVRNLTLTNINVSADPTVTGPGQFVGTLAGQNAGTIFNVAVTSGSVNGGAMTGVLAGGLVGQNGIMGPGGAAGTITSSSAKVNVTVGNGCAGPQCNGGINAAGGLVGSNTAGSTIHLSSAAGTIVAGSGGFAGGLVGQNGIFGFGTGAITSSFASGTVTVTGLFSAAGGLVGTNSPGSTITDSQAIGNVTSIANATNSDTFMAAGGLVGQNSGTITSTTQPSHTSPCTQGSSYSCARGNVSVGSNGTGGGLVGSNDGIIVNAFATGNVTGAPGTTGLNGHGGTTTLGGLAGNNQGLISNSHARGDVGSRNVANLQAGGLVGDNSGTILSSTAIGNVQAGDGSNAGGLVASNSVMDNFNCPGCTAGDGHDYFNTARISDSHAIGSVTVGAMSLAGGFAGSGDGTFTRNSAIGAVSAGHDSVLGGFIGALGPGSITQSTASGSVTSTGPNSVTGGFVGVTDGTITSSTSSGAVSVTGSSESFLGGFVGVNLGTITQSSTTPTASVTGLGNHDIIGGFVAVNFGSINNSSSAGSATGGPNSVVGGFAGANASFTNFAPGTIPGSSFPTGTITNSSATGTASGGAGSTVGPFIAVSNPTSGVPAYPSIVNGCDERLCAILRTGILGGGGGASSSSAGSPPQIIQNLVGNPQFAALNTDPVVTITPPPAGSPPPRQGPAPTNPYLPPGFDRRIIDIPPLTETRIIKDQVMLQIATTVTIERLQEAVRQFGLSLIEYQSLGTTGSIALRFRITDGQTIQDVIRRLASVQIVAVAQPIYVYALAQQPPADPAPPSRGDPGQQGNIEQYVLDKLKLADVHRIVKGSNISIAVIDSEIDAAHPDLLGVIAQRFSAVGAPEKPHAHGTGMAGAIASHQKVVGTAPGARLMAVHAFSTNAANAESTTYQILKGLDWAVSQGVRIINMSFAGPKDPSLERSLKAAYDKGIVLIAAAGNAGPKSPPLYPGADPNVIAVTATDVDDKLFTGANRGKYISVAAPGVDILVPAPEGAYQLTTGTSVAAAEVSGIVALLLERNPGLKPADIRRILTTSAKRLAPGERDDDFGSGLVDPLKAILLADPRTVSRTPAPTLRQR